MDTANPTLDPILTQALVTGAWDAYCDFGGQSWSPPTGFTYLTRFTGWNDFIEPLGSVERYGLIFFRQQDNGLQLLIAFRGTDSLLDAYEDGFADLATFVPYTNADKLPSQSVQVEAGFYGVYSLTGGGITQSMQQQIFSLLTWLQPAEVLVTGHSLGSALSQLFTLDMAVSMPDVAVTNINFASPRVGDASWGDACASLGVSQRITRVINYYDYVPTVPPEALGYVDVGAEFQVAFCAYYWFEANLYFNHMLGNLQIVLQNALATSNQQWIGTFSFQFLDVTIWMQSVAPPTDLDRNAWVARQQEAQALAHPTPRPPGPAELHRLLRTRGPR